MSTSPASNVQTRWDHVQVVGQFYRRGCVPYQDGLLRLCQSARQVFASQPTRLFLHGFYIRDSLIKFWVFDRSGLYCSDVFDIRKDFVQFLTIILSYRQMTDQDMGDSNLIATDKDGSYIILDSAATPSLGKIYLESRPIASREGIAGTGTTCYRARMPDSNRWDYVLKFKWRWARERPEDELLKLAKEKRAWGAVSLDYYNEIESTANLRRSLRWGTHRKFVTKTHASVHEQRHRDACNEDGLADYTEETDNYFQNRILTCIVTSPVGRSLDTFQSPAELLQVFRDAIKCHRSLYCDAKILHQDISAGNMVILDGQDEGKPKGILIDLDSAVELAEGSAERGITGTRPFMAIGVLKGTSKLRQWSNGDWDELAARKSLDMDQENFETILEEFTPEFHSLKSLAESLRQILFPLRDEVIWTGSDGSPEDVDKLYDGMIHAFEEAIGSEGGR
ncbi:hypothetical protein ACHAPT_000538 [Fusarium lateritium]